MKTNQYTNNQQLQITRDGALTTEYEPTTQDKLLNALEQAVRSAGEHIRVEVIAIAYDLIHQTHYNRRRHELMRIARNERHLNRIGLMRTSS